MKQYYGCPAERVFEGFRTFHRPSIAHAADSNGGCWKVCEQDHDGRDHVPTHFLVAINDRLDPSLPTNPAVWTAVNAVTGSTLLGGTLAAARAEAAILYGQMRADRMLEQVTGGE